MEKFYPLINSQRDLGLAKFKDNEESFVCLNYADDDVSYDMFGDEMDDVYQRYELILANCNF